MTVLKKSVPPLIRTIVQMMIRNQPAWTIQSLFLIIIELKLGWLFNVTSHHRPKDLSGESSQQNPQADGINTKPVRKKRSCVKKRPPSVNARTKR